MSALPGEHLCKKHQGNHSHYAEENCTVCKLEAINQGVYEQMAKALPVPPLCSGDNTIEGVRQMRLTMERQRGENRALEAEVERLIEAVNDGIGSCGMLQEADGIGRERLTDPAQIKERLEMIAKRNDDCVQEYDRVLGQARRIGELRAEVERLREALSFARCTIKCGEPWTETCEQVIDAALAGRKEGKDGD